MEYLKIIQQWKEWDCVCDTLNLGRIDKNGNREYNKLLVILVDNEFKSYISF